MAAALWLSATIGVAGPADDCANLSGAQAIRACDLAIKANPRQSDHYVNRGIARQSIGNRAGAMQDYDKAIALDPNAAYAFANRGVLLQWGGDVVRARTDYEKAIALDPKLVFAHVVRGDLLFNEGEYEQALASYRNAIEIEPKTPDAHYGIGEIHYASGDLERAVQSFSVALKADAKHSASLLKRGLSHRNLGQPDLAMKDVDAAIAFNPKHASAFLNRGLIWGDKGEAARAAADFDKAIELRSAAIRSDPKDVFELNGRCYARAVAGKDLEAALVDCSQALATNGRDADAFDSRGVVYLRLGRFAEARADFEAALSFRPSATHALYGRGIARFRSGDKSGGAADIAKAREKQPWLGQEFERYGFR